MTRRIVCLQHDDVDGPGFIADWALAGQHELRVLTASEALPRADGLDLLILLGGAASALDGTPRQLAERGLAMAVAEAGKPVFGLCLGAQMLAVALGGNVVPGAARERDWSAVDIDDLWLREVLGARRLMVFQAHYDLIQPPPGSVLLAESAACSVQAFKGPGPVLGLQFHLEANAEKVRAFRALWNADAHGSNEGLLDTTRAALFRLLDALMTAGWSCLPMQAARV